MINRNAVDLYSICLVTLLISLIYSNYLNVDSKVIMLSIINDNFIFFLNLTLMISFHYAPKLAKTSGKMLKRSGDGHPCLLPDFEGKTFNILSLHVVFSTCSTKFLCILEYTFLILNWKEFNSRLALEKGARLLALA